MYQNPGLKMMANVLLDIGKTLDLTSNVNTEYLMPSAAHIFNALQNKAMKERTELKSCMGIIVMYGGGVKYDVLNLKIKGRKFYDAVLHFFAFSKDGTNAVLHSRVHFLTQLLETEPAENMNTQLSELLLRLLGIDINSIKPCFTFVTDCILLLCRRLLVNRCRTL